MAKEEAKREASSEQLPENKSKKSLITFGLFGGVMLVEGVAIFLCMRLLGTQPDPTLGVEGLNPPATQPWAETEELEVVQLRVQNMNSSRATLYSVKVVVVVHQNDAEKIKEFLASKQNTIEDALSRIIRSAEPQHLAEPGLETLKRQFLFELNALIGDEASIERVLIPECTPLPMGF